MKKFLLLSAMFVFAAACSRESAPADAATEAGSENSAPSATAELIAMDCGRITMMDLSLFASDGEYDGRENMAADMCFFVRHADGDLMWDAGLPDALNANEDGVTNGPFHLSVPVTVASQLDAAGVAPADIEYFSISHSHFDHVGNAAMFAGSTFLIDKDERAFMFRSGAREDAESFALIAPLEDAETTEFDGDHDVFGDGSVVILDMPGHTPGHKSLLVKTVSETYLLTGDLYHLEEAREKRTIPQFNSDAEQTLASMDRFEALAEEHGARVIIQHSLDDMKALMGE
ncbi:MAG: N-acyl homoserine lactonase family protein [Marinicaulis sp.]|nr:N-acyl homoserine lactonase family protein [Marinicaulis sp.]